MKYSTYLFLIISFGLLSAQETVISGRITDGETELPVSGANIFDDISGVISNENGEFEFETAADFLTVSYIGYHTVTAPVSENMIIVLQPEVLRAEPVWVEATRAVSGVTPVAFSNLTPVEIGYRYAVEDVPMILAGEPGVYAYSESGNGTGYSYVSIRGFDQSRIAVMLNGVPLNDNESHQVYWVDHGDILSDAEDVQIQRGIGNSLYGSSAFGGSINILTGPGTRKGLTLNTGRGSYDTRKIKIKYSSHEIMDGNLVLFGRMSILSSDGYRDYHQSNQTGLSGGFNFKGMGGIHEFRALRGYERSNLAWDGVPAAVIGDREKRRESYRAYIDDFTQYIFSLRSLVSATPWLRVSNVTYLVNGAGYYETEKSSANVYEYNLDRLDLYPDSVEKTMETGLLQRKWIVNSYMGLTPTVSMEFDPLRFDIGMELRSYTGDHYGEVKEFTSNDLVIDQSFEDEWYRYYRYVGTKYSTTLFAHVSWKVLHWLRLIGDIQLQKHDWNLDQDRIGHAPGHRLNAVWDFVNPRAGLIAHLNPQASLFLNYGKGQKEPADNQIIEADDFWKSPRYAAAEVIHDYEAGATYKNASVNMNVNLFRIDYSNEQLKNIDIEREGEYEYSTEERTRHSGIEYDVSFRKSEMFSAGLNGTFLSIKRSNGEWLPGIPDRLFNIWASINSNRGHSLYLEWKHVGQQRIIWDWEGRRIDPSNVLNLKLSADLSILRIGLKVNNVFNSLYETQAYAWDTYYYWPGATRNYFLEVETTF